VTHKDFNRKEDIKPLAVAAVFAALALMWTAALAPLNKWWTKLGILLYRIVSPIVLGTPILRDGYF
jgi:hypothetical protein